MLNTPPLSLLLVLLASVLGAIGPFLFERASHVALSGIVSVLLNRWSLAGMACYVAVMVLFTSAFRLGGTVKVLYPIYASTFIWAALMAMVFQNQPIRVSHGVGMVLLMAGIFCMSR